jgi:uncharacterized membrane protein YhaH (DUF805 family)
MQIDNAVINAFSRYADFSSRTSREQYWWFTTAVVLVSIILSLAHIATRFSVFTEVLSLIFNLGILIPSISISVRRLHDINKSGWWLLIAFTLIGLIPIAYWAVKASDDSVNDYGLPAT